MLQNPRLGAPAFKHLHFHLSYDWPGGWLLSVAGMREGCDQYERDDYERLDVFELVDVLNADLALRLGL